MICHNCQQKNIVGAIFCLNCGTSLLPQDHKRDTTARLGARPAKASPTPAASMSLEIGAATEHQFRATILNNGRQVRLPLAAPILIGRQDTAKGFFPDLDLGNDGGYDSGVSRRHARIMIMDDAPYIEDLGSANGTFINDQRVEPRTPYRLQQTDELRFGSLILRIEHL